MFGAPTIIVAGDETLYLDVSERLPNSCRVLYCDTIGDTLDRAADAHVVVVDARMSGGGAELCRRLRTDPLTAGVSVLLRDGQQQPCAHADQVLNLDVDATVTAIGNYCPAAVATPEDAESTTPQQYFDLDQSTVSWRHSQDIDDWPCAPPTIEQAADPLSFAQNLAGYVHSLVEAHESPGTLTPRQQGRLREMSSLLLGQRDGPLGHVQVAVNEALRAGDLRHMHELSTAKTALLEQLQRLGRCAQEAGPAAARPEGPGAASRPGSMSAPARPTSSRAAALGSTGPRSLSSGQRAIAMGTTGPSPQGPPPAPTGTVESTGPLQPSRMSQPAVKPVKSQLTLAAERKAQRSRRRTQPDRRPRKRGPKASTAHGAPARRGETSRAKAKSQRAGQSSDSNLSVAIIAVVALAVVGLGAYMLLRNSSSEQAAPRSDNAPPEMKFVVVQETPAGMVARPQAEDPEGDRVVYVIRWFVDQRPIDDARTARLQPQHYAAGSVVQVQVTPADSEGRGEPMRSQPIHAKGQGPSKR